MKLVQYRLRRDATNERRVGLLDDARRTVRAIAGASSTKELLRLGQGPDGWTLGPEHAVEQIVLEAPIHDPDKMIFVGLNYYDHAVESNMAVPSVPVIFPKYANSIVGPEADVVIPAEVEQCDYEVELAVVIGKTAKRVPIERAMDVVFGYTIVNDVSARDIQLHEGQWTRGKAIDTFAPLGPFLATKDEIPDPHALAISLRLNGEDMQRSNTKELIFSIPYLISFLSRTITLSPGDVISTGTPPGVGMGKKPPVWLKDGDVTEAFVQGLGTLSNRFVRERLS